jgi:hypothetical protein
MGFGLPNKTITLIASNIKDMLKDYIDKQIQLGVLDAAPSEFNIVLKHKFDEMVGGFQDGGRLMLDITRNLLEHKEEDSKRCVVLVEQADGSFKKDE